MLGELPGSVGSLTPMGMHSLHAVGHFALHSVQQTFQWVCSIHKLDLFCAEILRVPRATPLFNELESHFLRALFVLCVE